MNTNTEEWGNIELPGLSDEELFKKKWNLSRKNNQTYQQSMKELHSSKDYVNVRMNAIKSRSAEERKQTGKNITNSKLKINQDQVDYIWNLGWSPDRGTKLYKKLCIEFNIKPHTIFNILNGVHPLKQVDQSVIIQMKEDWKSKFGHKRGENISKGKVLSNTKKI